MRGEGHHCPHFGFLVFWHRLGWMDDFSSWYCYLINGSSIYMKKREAEQSVHQESCDRVKRIASDAIVSSSDSSGSLSAWLRQSGAKMDGLYFKTSDECGQTLGCFTNKAIEAGDILFTVPRRCLYGLRDVLDSELTNYILQEAEKREKVDICSAEKLLWTNMIASRLSPSANWSPYFDSLDKMSPSALSWPSDLLSLLDDTNQGTALKTLAQSLQDYHVLLVDIMQSSPEESQRHGLVAATCDLEALRWACGHYLSRRYPEHFHPCSATQSTHTLFQRRETNFGNLGTMVPLLDVLNHDDQRDWLRFDVQDDALVVISNYPRAPGDELFSNYGCLGNDQLLFAFGFAKAHNPFDEFNLKLKGMATFSIPVNGEISQVSAVFTSPLVDWS